MTCTCYPALKKSPVTGTVVLFTAPRKGVVIHPGDSAPSDYTVGHSSDTWHECLFMPFKGSLLLVEDDE